MQNVGKKIKVVSIIFLCVGITASVICAFKFGMYTTDVGVYLKNEVQRLDDDFFPILLGGIFLSIVSSLLMYGFGTHIETTESIYDTLYDMNHQKLSADTASPAASNTTVRNTNTHSAPAKPKPAQTGGQSYQSEAYTFCKNSDGGLMIVSFTDKNQSDLVIPSANKGASVVSISQQAFADCKNLQSVSIPETVTFIGARAFCGCTALKTVSIPGSVKRIAGGAFLNCPELKTVKYAGTREQWEKIEIADGNEALKNAEIEFNC